MNSNKVIYDWKRYWVSLEDDEETYHAYSQLYENKKVTLADLRDEKCLILLGDAALGKTTVLKDEYKKLLNSNLKAYFIDLKYVSDQASLKDKFIELQKYCHNKSRVYLLMDSFDESQLIFKNIVNCLIDSLKSLNLKNIYIRITCRTVVFPQYLLDELKQLAYEKKEVRDLGNIKKGFKHQFEIKQSCEKFSVKIYRLLPLDEADIDTVLEHKNINKDDFYNNILLSEELKTPIVILYIIDNYQNIGNKSQFEIYSNICKQLCSEFNGQYNKQILNINERIKIIEILFTLMLFSNKYLISYDKNVCDFSSDDIFYTQKYFNDIKNISDILRFAIPTSNIEEVLNTGLFTGKCNCITCIQKTYMEFLVAKFILDCDLYNNFKNLMFDEYGKVLPPFVNTICWLADQNDAIFDEVYLKDPDILLTSIVSFSSEEKNIKLLEKFYELLKTEGIYGLTSYSFIFKKLSIPKNLIIKIVEKYLKSDDPTCIAMTIELLDINNIVEFKNYIFNIAISKEHSFHCRLAALSFLKQHAISDLHKISEYVDNFIVEDLEETSKYAYLLINLLAPDYLPEAKFRKIINQNLENTFYYHVKLEVIERNQGLHKIMLSKLLELLIDKTEEDTYHIEDLLNKLIKNLPFGDIEYIANFIYDISKYTHLYLKLDLCSAFKNINKKIKYEIFDYIFNNLLISQDKYIYPAGYYENFFDKQDLMFLIGQFNKSKNKNIKKLLFDLCRCKFPFYKYIVNINWLTKDIIYFIKNRKLIIEQYHLYSVINKLKKFYHKIKNVCLKTRTFIFKKRPIDFVRKILSKDVFLENDWNDCIYYLLQINNPQEKKFSFCPIDCEYTDGCYILTPKEKKQLFDLAKFYVENQLYDAAKINNRLTTNSFTPLENMLIVPAIYMLYKKDEKKLRDLLYQDEIIKKSLPYIINYPIDNYLYDETKSCRIELLKYFIDNNEAEFLKTLAEIIDIKLSVRNDEIYLEFLEDFYNIDNERLNDVLFEKINILLTKNIYTKSELYILEHIGKYLTIKNYFKCKELFVSVLKDANKPICLKIIAAKFLACYNNAFDVYKNLLDTNEEFATGFICNAARNYFDSGLYQNNKSIKLNLNSIELAQFFIILEKYYPASEDTYPNGGVTQRQEIAYLRRNIINKSINNGDLAFFDYIKNNSELNIQSFWISNAKRNYTILHYQHINVEDLIMMILKENSYAILNNFHLYEVVLKALEEIKLNLREDTNYLRLWNEYNNESWPKDERALNDELKRLLKIKLRNIIVNREVEIFPKISGAGNDIPDLLVQCQIGQNDIASVIIETKCCWNPNLRESIKTQLYDRYMRDDMKYKYGIYLIGWYWCDKWSKEKKENKIKQIRHKKRFSETDINKTIEYFEECSRKLSDKYKKVKTIVLDLSLPK